MINQAIGHRVYTYQYLTAVIIYVLSLFQPLAILSILLIYSLIGNGIYRPTPAFRSYMILLCSVCITMLAVINMSKINESDLINYVDNFLDSGRYGLLETLSHLKKPTESMYTVYTWLIYHLLGRDQIIFKFITTLIIYVFLSIATFTFCIKVTNLKGLTIATLIITLFNPYIFSLSLHVIRQMLAVSIFVYVLVEYCLLRKKNWILIVSCPFIHTMSLLFVILLFIPILRKPIKGNLVGYGIVLLTLASIKIISSYFLSFSFLSASQVSYALSRAASETGYDLEPASFLAKMLALSILLCSFYLGQYKIEKCNEGSIAYGLRHLYNISMMGAFFVLLNTNISEVFTRFLMFLYPFIPFIFCGLLMNTRFKTGFYISISFIVVFVFIKLVENGVWTYQNLYEVFTSGYVYLLLS